MRPLFWKENPSPVLSPDDGSIRRSMLAATDEARNKTSIFLAAHEREGPLLIIEAS
jgi:hypothetical protein